MSIVFHRKKGFTLIEVIAAMGILVVGLVGAVSAVAFGLRGGTDSVNRTIATNLAAEGLELVRNVRDGNKIKIDNGSGILWTDGMARGTCGTLVPVTTCSYMADFNLNVPPTSTYQLCLVGTDSSCSNSNATLPLSFNAATGQYAYNGWDGFAGTASQFSRTITITPRTDAGMSNATYLDVVSQVTWQSGKKMVKLETYLYDWRP